MEDCSLSLANFPNVYIWEVLVNKNNEAEPLWFRKQNTDNAVVLAKQYEEQDIFYDPQTTLQEMVSGHQNLVTRT